MHSSELGMLLSALICETCAASERRRSGQQTYRASAVDENAAFDGPAETSPRRHVDDDDDVNDDGRLDSFLGSFIVVERDVGDRCGACHASDTGVQAIPPFDRYSLGPDAKLGGNRRAVCPRRPSNDGT